MIEKTLIDKIERNQLKIEELQLDITLLKEINKKQDKLIGELSIALKKSNGTIDNLVTLLKSAKPIKSIYSQIIAGPWVRIYHTDENWLKNHNEKRGTKFTDEVIGYAVTKNPSDFI